MAELLVIVPSRGRPHAVAALHDAWAATTTGAAALLVAVDDDDPACDEYVTVCADRDIELVIGPRLRMCPTLNHYALQRAPHHFAIGFMGDDHRPQTPAWNQRYLDELHALGTGFVYGDDLLRGETLPTQVAVTSDVVTTLGYMVPDGIKHLWADNVWHDLGHAIDRIRYLSDVVVEHLHPAAGKGEWDAGYLEVNADDANDADRDAYQRWIETQKDTDVAKLRALL